MAKSLIQLQAGMRYQAWLFWSYAAGLLEPGTNVAEVAFEAGGVRSFDDIVVSHEPPLQERLLEPIRVIHVQSKYHGITGAFTIPALADPAFIGADTVSLLGLLGEAYRRLGPDEYLRRRFWIVSPWPFHPNDDLLHALWRDNTAAISIDVLRQGKTRKSRWGELRALWRDVVGVTHDDELYAILSRLRLGAGEGDLNGRFAKYVSAQLRSVGLKGIDPTRADEPYGQIPWGLHDQGETHFTKAKLEAVAEQYDLWDAGRRPAYPGRRLGVRTAVRWGEQMESTAAAFLPLEDQFEGRFIRDEAAWPGLYQQVHTFLREQLRHGGPHLLDVGAVSTIAFAAGYALPAKDGFPISPIQRRRDGADIWDAPTADPSRGAWRMTQDLILRPEGPELAVGVAVSQFVFKDSQAYVSAHLPSVGRVVELQPETGTGQQSIVSGGHALHLAEQLAYWIRDMRRERPGAVVHLFLAAPNGLTFMIGQQGERLGRCHLYEFDFGAERTGSYRPSLLVPDHTR
jgi:hypothetical protein